jgi:MFS family permease
MVPAALAVVVAASPVGEWGSALAIFFGVRAGLTAIGPIAGGYLTQWTWRAIFWINIPVAITALVLTQLAGITTRGRKGRSTRRGQDAGRGAVNLGRCPLLSVSPTSPRCTWAGRRRRWKP